MHALYTIFLIVYSIGCFFSTALCHIGYFGFLGIALLQFCFDSKLRFTFKQFFTLNKIWLPAVFIVIIAFFGVFYSGAPQNVRWCIFSKYARFLSIFLLIPAFIYNKSLAHKFIHYFCLATIIYCLWDCFIGREKIHLVNSIHSSIFVTLCSIFCFNLYFFQKKLAKNFSLIWSSFALYYLLFVNAEKTGPFAFVIAFILVIVTAIKRISLFQSICSVSGIILCMVAFAWYKPSALLQNFGVKHVNKQHLKITNESKQHFKITNLVKTSSVSERLSMAQNCFTLIKEKPVFGHGTGSFGYELQQHKMIYIGYNFSDVKKSQRIIRIAHPHNEWLLWLVQWGSLGFIAGCWWFGWLLWYLIKNRKVDDCLVMHGVVLNVIFITGACCEALFFTTIPQSVYLMALCACIGSIELKKFKVKRFRS